MTGRLKVLKDALVALARTADEQLLYLKERNVADCIDELALYYDAIAEAADSMLEEGELDERQRGCVKQLNEFLAQFSGKENAGLWTPEALSSAPQWEQVRRMASNCLSQQLTVPTADWMKGVGRWRIR